MTQVTLDPAAFRENPIFDEFSDESEYPDTCLDMYWAIATCYLDDQTNCLIGEECLTLALQLMMAHIMNIGNAASMGSGTGVVEQGTIDDVTTKLKLPSFDNDIFNYWINSSEYGKMIYAMFSGIMVGGVYIGGSSDIKAFRGPRGLFNA